MALSKTLSFECTVARPGVYHNKLTGKDEKITLEELKRAQLLYNRIPIIVNETDHYGPIDPRHAVGFVDTYCNRAEGKIDGKAIFFREKWHNVPEEMQRDLEQRRFVPSSLGYTAKVDEEDVQRARKYDHILLGVKNPMHPYVGVHAESGMPSEAHIEHPDFRYEEAGFGEDKKEETETVVRDTLAEFKMSEKDVKRIADAIHALLLSTEKEPPEEKTTTTTDSEPERPEVVEEVTPTEPQEGRHEPSRIIPKDVTPTKRDGIFEAVEFRSTQLGGEQLPPEREEPRRRR